MGSTLSGPSVEKATGMDDVNVGIVGTGRMATAHATAWTKLGLSVFIGSRDKARAARLASQFGCKGGTHAEMLAESNFILLCIMPGPDSVAFINSIKDQVMGKGLSFCDMSASYTRFYTDASRAPAPYKSHLMYMKEHARRPVGELGEGVGQRDVDLHLRLPAPADGGGRRFEGEGDGIPDADGGRL